MAKTILIVEDETVLRESLAELLTGEGYRILQAGDGKTAYELAMSGPLDLVLSDVRMPEMDGITLLGNLRRLAPETPVIMITAYGTVQSAVAAMRSGACDYLLKPVQFDDLLLKIQRTLEYGEAGRTVRLMTEQLAADSVFHNLVGHSAPMVKLFEMVRKLSTVKSNVLIIGESGTGKELFARAIHYNGLLRDKPFVPINCGAIPDTLIESELFGYRRGAFTGATRDKIGYFERPAAARCSWMKYRPCPWRSRARSCECSRSGSSCRWATRILAPRTRGSSPRPARTWTRWWLRVNSARTCSTA